MAITCEARGPRHSRYIEVALPPYALVKRLPSQEPTKRPGLARPLLLSAVPEVPIRSEIFHPIRCLSQAAGDVTDDFGKYIVVLAVAAKFQSV